VEITLVPVQLDQKQVIYCVWRDMTEPKRAQADLIKREKQFLALSTMSSDWFWQQDEEFRFTGFSGAFANDFTPPANTVGKTRWELNIVLTPAQWAAHRASINAHLPFRNFEYPIVGDNGELRWYSVNGEPQFDETGHFTGYQGTGSNITARKVAENEVLKLSQVVEQSADSIIIADINVNIEYVNQAFVRNTGYKREEVIGKTPRFLQSGKTPRDTYSALWAALARGETWRGELYNRRKDGSECIEFAVISPIRGQGGSVTHYVAQQTDISSRKAADDKIQNLAFYDPLTALPNRRLLIDRLQHALSVSVRHQRLGVLLLIDLDDFKTLNDSLGHDRGDLLLQQVARRLSDCIRTSDTVARVGGDEFIVLLEDLGKNSQEVATQAKALGEKIIAALGRPYDIGSSTLHSTASIGIALFDSAQLGGTEDPLKQAELAMYQAKASGRNTLRFFDPQMQAVVSARALLEASLRQAIGQNQFVLYYQAQVNAERQITGMEALVRWLDPRRGMVSPAEFIPLAEETGLILPLGNWVMETACLQLSQWAGQASMSHFTVAVNVSAREFRQSDFVDRVLAALERTGANPKRLKLELTESMLVDDIEGVIGKMSALKRRGVGFSLDDFGTGYSSLAYLKRLPLDQLKIDQSFVRDILLDANDAAIAKMVIALAKSMGLAVIAEGVETEAQCAFLADLGCHAYQGYLFSKPLPLLEFEAFSQRVC
jgi:diguanylate cyclase (GGDEF)-like protein/PAS domain S-box-containing protein